MKTFVRIVLLLGVVVRLPGQTTIDLRHQARNVNFSNAAATTPWKTSTDVPQSCVPGEAVFRTQAPIGVYLCTADNQWTALGSPNPSAGTANAVQAANGSGGFADAGCTASSGAMTCPNGFTAGSGPLHITGNTGAAPAAPASGQVAVYSDSTLKGLSAKDDAGQITRTVRPTDCSAPGLMQKINADGSVTCGVAGVAAPASASSACTTGQVASDASYAYFCVATNTWKRVAITTW